MTFKDCDRDSDCNFGLICYERDIGQSIVPGCSGDADQIAYGKFDFCVQRPTKTTLILLADAEDDESWGAYPLGLCQGDCRDDNDCAGALTCFYKETEATTVPGCSGKGEADYSYCVVA